MNDNMAIIPHKFLWIATNKNMMCLLYPYFEDNNWPIDWCFTFNKNMSHQQLKRWIRSKIKGQICGDVGLDISISTIVSIVTGFGTKQIHPTVKHR